MFKFEGPDRMEVSLTPVTIITVWKQGVVEVMPLLIPKLFED